MSKNGKLRMTKVVATLGPACDDPDVLDGMIQAGMNVARLNLSHGSHADHTHRLERLQHQARKRDANVAVMLDTKGPEIRTGPVPGKALELETGSSFALFAEDRPVTSRGVSISHPHLSRDVEAGSTILLDDGQIELRVTDIRGNEILCEVVHGGSLEAYRHLHAPGVRLSLGSLGRQDLGDLAFAAACGADYLAASFVRSADDVRVLRSVLAAEGAQIPIIAKIECREGVDHLAEIVEEADGTMVARGDLGMALPVESVPIVQKRIIRATVLAGKPAITATQMLDSMERNLRPTRAEASDVANAILDGTSAVMLSGETARGRHPVEAVRTMAAIAAEAEDALREYGDLQRMLPDSAPIVTDAVAHAAITLAGRLQASALLTLTESGFTSRSISKYRPRCPILAITTSPRARRRLALNWGVTAVLYTGDGSDDERIAFGVNAARELGCAQSGDVVVATAGISREAGSTNLIRVVSVP